MKFLNILLLLVLPFTMVRGQEQPPQIHLPELVVRLGAYTQMASREGLAKSKPDVLLRLGAVDRDLARFPYLKGIILAVIQDVNSLGRANENFYKDQQKSLQKSQNKVIKGDSGVRPNGRIKPPKFDINQQPYAGQSDLFARQAVFEKSIQSRLALLEKQFDTPVGQQFAVGATNPFWMTLTGEKPASTTSQGFMRSFEAISISEGGLLAYEQKLVQTKDVVSDEKGGTRLQTSESYESDRPKTVFVKGYTTPVAMGDHLRLRVIPVGMRKVQDSEVFEYSLVP